MLAKLMLNFCIVQCNNRLLLLLHKLSACFIPKKTSFFPRKHVFSIGCCKNNIEMSSKIFKE